MTQRQIIHSVDADDYAWLKALAEGDGCGVGEIVRRCIVFARQSQEEDPPGSEEANNADVRAAYLARVAAAEMAARRAALIAAKQAELDALLNDEPEPIAPNEMSVLDLDLSNEPRAEEMDVPPDPDDGPPRAVAQWKPTPPARVNQAPPSLLEMEPPPSGARPGTATRPAPPRSESAFGLKMGDAQGNVVRANFAHLGFSRGGI